MNSTALGNTGITVSRLCFGTGTTKIDCESAQSKLPVDALGSLLVEAHRLGVTFWDTADNYNTYAHVAWALARLPRNEVVITSKTHAATAVGARASLDEALRELGTDYLDVMLLHEPDSPEEFEERRAALQELHKAKREGKIRSVGLSTHAILTLEHVAGLADIEVILTNFNVAEDHMDAGIEHYRAAMQQAHAAGQGVVSMKTLGEGRLAHRKQETITYSLSQPFIHSVVVGMMNAHELDENVAIAKEHLHARA
ncbi:MAG: aldo/keto reductase [Cyanobacteria bacterium RYN_339]|nr:aldo/keto reductase [Cyanobacteria bacterium RYN_339]